MIAHEVKKINLIVSMFCFETVLRFQETTNITYSKLRSQDFILHGQQIICFQFAASVIDYAAKHPR